MTSIRYGFYSVHVDIQFTLADRVQIVAVCVYMCVCVFMCVCVRVCAGACTDVCVCVRVHMYIS